MRAPADAERAASVGHRETFDVDAFATACASALGFDADAVEDAVEILMECAPTLVEKNVVAIDASFVRPRPRASSAPPPARREGRTSSRIFVCIF